MRIDQPTYTQIPNVILDGMAGLSDTELRVAMFVCRQTFGWHRDSVKLTLAMIVKATGKAKSMVAPAVKSLEAKGTIKRQANGQGFIYLMVYEEKQPVQQPDSRQDLPVRQPDNACPAAGQTPVRQPDTQYKETSKENFERKVASEQESKIEVVEPSEVLMGLWSEAWKETFGMKYAGTETGDRQAAIKITKQMTPEAFIEVVKRAWKCRGWKCQNFTGTITSVVYRFDQIAKELKQHEDSKSNPASGASRTAGTLNAGRSNQYANSAKKT